MRIAHALLVHHKPHQARKLIDSLEHPDVDIWVHIDKRADSPYFRECLQKENVYFIEDNVRVFWAGMSVVEAMLLCIRSIVRVSQRKYDYINFLSGQDYPLSTPYRFLSFLKQSSRGEFMGFRPVIEGTEDGYRCARYYFNDAGPFAKRILEKLSRVFLGERKFPFSYSLMRGTQWVCLTREACEYILDFSSKNRKFFDYFKYVQAPDEFYFHTILCNSPFRDKIVNRTLHFTNWSEGSKHPGVLSFQDIDVLQDGLFYFARKFDLDSTPDVFERINKRILFLETHGSIV